MKELIYSSGEKLMELSCTKVAHITSKFVINCKLREHRNWIFLWILYPYYFFDSLKICWFLEDE